MAIVCGVVITVSLMTTIADMIALHPYESVYFNRLIAGGLRSAAGSYETDYWGNSYREGVEWLVTHYGPSASATQPIRVASCSHPLSRVISCRRTAFAMSLFPKNPQTYFSPDPVALR